MHRRTRTIGTAVVVVGLAACASNSGNQQDLSAVSPAQLRWAGQIKPVERNTGQVGQVRPVMMNGSVEMTQDDKDSTRSHIEIALSSPNADASVTWALLPDRCGTGSVPVLPVNNFQPLEVGSGGRAQASATIPFGFPKSGNYHVDLYAGTRATLSDVIACANLKLEAK